MKHLLTVDSLNEEDIHTIFFLAKKFLRESSQCLLGKTIVNVFFENSTRTLTSFEIAAKKLGGQVINFSSSSSSIHKGESIADTIYTINQMSPDFIVVRAAHSGVIHPLTNSINCSIINAGDGCNEHPTQGLIDAFTIQQLKGTIAGLKIAICGDILHNRVAHSNIKLLSYLGAEVRIVSPPNFILPNLPDNVIVYQKVEECFKAVDVIMILRLQYERMKSAYVHSQSEYFKIYGLNQTRLSCAKDDVIVMHPGPINRGIEISSDVADNNHSAILEQVKFSVPVRQAIFNFLALSTY